MDHERVAAGCTLAFGLVVVTSSVLTVQRGGSEFGAALGVLGSAILVLTVLDAHRRPNRSIGGGSSVYLGGTIVGLLLSAGGLVLRLL